jgi:hypothetical protein
MKFGRRGEGARWVPAYAATLLAVIAACSKPDPEFATVDFPVYGNMELPARLAKGGRASHTWVHLESFLQRQEKGTPIRLVIKPELTARDLSLCLDVCEQQGFLDVSFILAYGPLDPITYRLSPLQQADPTRTSELGAGEPQETWPCFWVYPFRFKLIAKKHARSVTESRFTFLTSEWLAAMESSSIDEAIKHAQATPPGQPILLNLCYSLSVRKLDSVLSQIDPDGTRTFDLEFWPPPLATIPTLTEKVTWPSNQTQNPEEMESYLRLTGFLEQEWKQENFAVRFDPSLTVEDLGLTLYLCQGYDAYHVSIGVGNEEDDGDLYLVSVPHDTQLNKVLTLLMRNDELHAGILETRLNEWREDISTWDWVVPPAVLSQEFLSDFAKDADNSEPALMLIDRRMSMPILVDVMQSLAGMGFSGYDLQIF